MRSNEPEHYHHKWHVSCVLCTFVRSGKDTYIPAISLLLLWLLLFRNMLLAANLMYQQQNAILLNQQILSFICAPHIYSCPYNSENIFRRINSIWKINNTPLRRERGGRERSLAEGTTGWLADWVVHASVGDAFLLQMLDGYYYYFYWFKFLSVVECGTCFQNRIQDTCRSDAGENK